MNMKPTKYFDKDEFIVNFVKGKSVLHIGCVGYADLDDKTRIELAKHTVHWKISKVADVIGIDYAAKVINKYKELGIFDNVVEGNAEKLEDVDLDKTFDIIVMGDIIEHLANPGLMLQGVRRFCHPDSKLIITTPHAFGMLNFIRFCFNRFKEGGEHVMTFNTYTLVQLLDRYDYHMEEIYTCHQPHARKINGPYFHAGKAFFKLFPKLGGTLALVAGLKYATTTS